MPTLMTVTKNLFSSSSYIDPEIDPIAQQSVLRFFHDHSSPLTWTKNDSEHFHDDFKTYFIGTVGTHGTCVKCYTKLDLDHLGVIFKIFNFVCTY